MSLWILDTDHVSLFLGGNKSIIAQVAKHSEDIAITVITVQELFNGKLKSIAPRSLSQCAFSVYQLCS